MFRQEEIFVGGWREKTIEAMHRRRYEQQIAQLPPLGSLGELSSHALERRLERCWQNIERKPMRSQQLSEIRKRVLAGIELQADWLSREEHELVERALILGGCVQLEDMQELEAARALSLRLWANIGEIGGKPYLELETAVLEPAARAFARPAHDAARNRLDRFHMWLTGMLYRVGAIDDRQPQRLLLRDAPEGAHEEIAQLARRYLWASHDCVDYSGGVMLVHSALAEPHHLLVSGRRRVNLPEPARFENHADILPEEIPLAQALERAIRGALRDGYREEDVARDIRFLCKQGAPLCAMEEVLQSTLIVCLNTGMRAALANMYYSLPKWVQSMQCMALQ